MGDELRDFIPLDDVMAEFDARDAAHAARPALVRVPINGYRWARRTIRGLSEVSPWRRAKWRIQRAQRGWSDPDVWNMHWHLASVIGGMTEHLRDQGHCHPGDMTPDEWSDYLTRIAEPLLVDLDRDIPGEPTADMLARDERERAAQVEAMRLVVERFHYLWD